MDDFGFDGQGNLDVQDGSSVKNDDNKNDDANAQHLGVNDDPGKSDIDNPGDTDNHDNDEGKKDDDADKKDKDSKISLTEGQIVEIGEDSYTVDKDGNLVDKDGKIFKEAKDVPEFLKEFDVDDSTDENALNIENIQKALGYELTGDDDKPIEFENSPEGVKAYIDAVVNTAKEEHYETAINTLYQKYPVIKDVLNYYIANGNSLEGFGEIPDRSNITVDDNNEEQQIAIIRTAWKERGQKGDLDGYLAYLKSSGTLLATAREELANIQESDKQYREELEAEAEKQEAERVERLEKYWNGVHDVIKSRTIAGYKIPESIIINRNNQKISVTPEDFFNYIYRVDKNGKSAYEHDLEAETPESRRDDEILRAYLKFVGGNYSNLVDMAINNEKVTKLKLRAKERNSTSVRINRPKATSQKGVNIDLGYN